MSMCINKHLATYTSMCVLWGFAGRKTRGWERGTEKRNKNQRQRKNRLYVCRYILIQATDLSDIFVEVNHLGQISKNL